MNTNKNSYTLIYAIVMVVIVALLLAIVSDTLKPLQNENVALDKKKQILSSLKLDLAKQDVSALYDKYIVKELVINSKAEIISEVRGDAFIIDVVKENAKPLAPSTSALCCRNRRANKIYYQCKWRGTLGTCLGLYCT